MEGSGSKAQKRPRGDAGVAAPMPAAVAPGKKARAAPVEAAPAAPVTPIVAYTNKQRVLVFGSRGMTARYRHLMEDMRKLIPHHKKESKVRRGGARRGV